MATLMDDWTATCQLHPKTGQRSFNNHVPQPGCCLNTVSSLAYTVVGGARDNGPGHDDKQQTTTATAPLTTAGANGRGTNADSLRGMGARGANEEPKQDQEERLRKLRLAEDAQDQESDPDIRNFAPQGQGVDTLDLVATPRMARMIPSRIDTDIMDDSKPEEPHSVYEPSILLALSSHYGTIYPGEYAVVAQLYHKVKELQEVNAELGARNRIVHVRLARAKLDALEIKCVYDEIGEEICAEADVELSDVSDGTQVRRARMARPQGWGSALNWVPRI